jgi:hypothetical protein
VLVIQTVTFSFGEVAVPLPGGRPRLTVTGNCRADATVDCPVGALFVG